jgi:hypothetical protein
VFRSSDAIAAEPEEIIDLIMGWEETLRLTGRFELLPRAYASDHLLLDADNRDRGVVVLGAGFSGRVAALRALAESARKNSALKTLIEAATTSEPLRPALNRALVDAWSLTSLPTHTGRADVAPWLRGWMDDRVQTTIIWRTHLPLREGTRDWPRTSSEQKEVEDFFDAAAPHENEKLETETYRVASPSPSLDHNRRSNRGAHDFAIAGVVPRAGVLGYP